MKNKISVSWAQGCNQSKSWVPYSTQSACVGDAAAWLWVILDLAEWRFGLPLLVLLIDGKSWQMPLLMCSDFSWDNRLCFLVAQFPEKKHLAWKLVVLLPDIRDFGCRVLGFLWEAQSAHLLCNGPDFRSDSWDCWQGGNPRGFNALLGTWKEIPAYWCFLLAKCCGWVEISWGTLRSTSELPRKYLFWFFLSHP